MYILTQPQITTQKWSLVHYNYDKLHTRHSRPGFYSCGSQQLLLPWMNTVSSSQITYRPQTQSLLCSHPVTTKTGNCNKIELPSELLIKKKELRGIKCFMSEDVDNGHKYLDPTVGSGCHVKRQNIADSWLNKHWEYMDLCYKHTHTLNNYCSVGHNTTTYTMHVNNECILHRQSNKPSDYR